MGVLQQIIDNCVGGADEDLEMLRACVMELKPEVLPQQLTQEEEEEGEDVVSLQEQQKQNEWEGAWLHGDQQPPSDSAQQLFDHVSNDHVSSDHVSTEYVITRDEDEPAVLLPTDTIGNMGTDISVVTKSSGAILIESPEASHDLEEVPLSAYEPLDRSHEQVDRSHDQTDRSHEQVDRSHDPADESHEPHKGSHEFIIRTREPLEVLDDSMNQSHVLTQGSHGPIDELLDTLDGSSVPLGSSHEPLEGSCDHGTSQGRVTEINLESHDLFSGSLDLTEQLFDDEETSGTYRHRSLTAASVSNTPYISLASTNGRQDNSFEAIPLTTGSKKKRVKKSGKKKKKQQASSSTATATTAPPPDVQPPQPPPPVEEEQLQPPPVQSKCNHYHYICTVG